MSGQITTWRTMRNVTGEDQPLDVSVQAPSGVEIIVAAAEKKGGAADKTDRTIAVEAGAERLIQITIKAPSLANGQYFGQITLTPKKKGFSPVVIPVAFNKRQGQVLLAHSCAPSSFSVAGSTTCTVRAENFSPGQASAAIEVNASKGSWE